MKKKQFNVKLQLNKETIAKFDLVDKNKIYGGANGTTQMGSCCGSVDKCTSGVEATGLFSGCPAIPCYQGLRR